MTDPEFSEQIWPSRMEVHRIELYLPQNAAPYLLREKFGRLAVRSGGWVKWELDGEDPAFADVQITPRVEVPREALFNPGHNLFTPEIQADLDRSVTEVFSTGNAGVAKDLRTPLTYLRAMGVYSVRDAMLGGLEYLRSGINMGPKSIGRVQEAIAKACLHVPWRPFWHPEEAALFCDSLDQVPLYVLRRGPERQPFNQMLIGGPRRQTIAGFLARDRHTLSRVEATEIRPLVAEFAEPFETARSALDRPAG